MLKEHENPPTTWPEDKSVRDFAGPWSVAHTKSRNEKALANDLMRKNISYFLPMTWKISHKNGRKIRSLLPLFSGYLFFAGNEDQRLELLRTHRVANIIPVDNQIKFVNELVQIEQAIRAGAPLLPHKHLKAGQKCRVLSGPLAGLQGIILKTRQSARLILQVDMLGQAASVEVDMDIIEILEDSD